MTRSKQSGSHVLALALVVLVVGVVAFAGYSVMQRNKTSKDATKSDTTVAAPEAITTESDLTATSQSLDDSSAGLNSSLDDSTLDSSMNDLL